MELLADAPRDEVVARFDAAIASLGALPRDVSVLRALDEVILLQLNTLHAEAARLLGAAGATIAGEILHRSRPELGSAGLAQRSGHRTPENFIRATTGATKEHTVSLLRAGSLLTGLADDGRVDKVTGEVREAAQPWLRSVATALRSGAISVAAAQSIARGLRGADSAVSIAGLTAAAEQLVAASIAGVDADRLWRNARDLRDDLDLAGVRIREDEQRAARGLSHAPLPGGGGRATWTMDVETYALFRDIHDRMASPKLGGVRFVDPVNAGHAKSIESDPRTPFQLASDGFLQLIMAGADADDSVMLGSGAPVIRVTVTEEALSAGFGLARIDGQVDPVSIDTARRLACGGNIVRVGFDAIGGAVSLESEGRLFTKRQHEVLAAKFGGCMDPDCDRPPSWCEAHHIKHWVRDRGKTVLVNGILLCRWHHLKYHNDGIEIERDEWGRYWKVPRAAAHEAARTLMPFKTRNLADLRVSAAGRVS
jgi:hypothetical protein